MYFKYMKSSINRPTRWHYPNLHQHHTTSLTDQHEQRNARQPSHPLSRDDPRKGGRRGRSQRRPCDTPGDRRPGERLPRDAVPTHGFLDFDIPRQFMLSSEANS